MRGFYCNITTEEYDEENNGPLIIHDMYGAWLGSLKGSQKHDEDLLKLVNNAVEEGMKQGRRQKSHEVRMALGI